MRLSSSEKNKRCVEAAVNRSCTSPKNLVRCGSTVLPACNEAGIRAETPGEVVDGFVTAHRVGERGAGIGRFRHVGELAFIGFLESHAFCISAIEIALDRRIVETGIEVGQIPFGQ